MSTPIQQAMNIGPATAPELISVGVPTLEALQEIGWEEAYERIIARYPDRLHSMYAYALIGAERGINCISISAAEKDRAKKATRRLKAERGG